MKLVLEIVFNDDAMREPTDVCEAIDRINTWPLRFIAGEGAPIFDRNGATVASGKLSVLPILHNFQYDPSGRN